MKRNVATRAAAQSSVAPSIDCAANRRTGPWRMRPLALAVAGAASAGQTLGAPGVPFTLTFPTASAVISQTVFVQAVNDNVDEPQDPHIGAIVHTSSGTSDYNGLTVTDNINIVNDDVAQILLGAPGTMVLSETVGLNQSTTFTASLGSRPVSNVTLNFAASNGQCSVSPASELFDAASATDWGVERVVTVTAVNDAFDDGDQPCTAQITVTTNDTSYQINPPDYAFTVLDDDKAGYVVCLLYTSDAADE